MVILMPFFFLRLLTACNVASEAEHCACLTQGDALTSCCMPVHPKGMLVMEKESPDFLLHMDGICN